MNRAAVGLALVLAGCASREQMQPADAAWQACIRENAARMDDGKSDPVSLAVGIAPQCQWDGATGSFVPARGMSDTRKKLNPNEIQLITTIILEQRAGRRS